MRAVVLDAARPMTKGEKVAIISFENVQEYHELDNVGEALGISGTLEVRAYFSPEHLADVINALEAVGADVDVRSKEGH